MTEKTENLYANFKALAEIDSVSFCERQMADKLIDELKKLGFDVHEDEAGNHYHGNAGNVYGFLKGTLPGTPILLSAHMDTVEPGIGKKVILKDDERIMSGGDTVLGADDICGIIEILEGIRTVQKKGIAHRDVEVLFSIAEEVYIKGSSAFDYSKMKAEEAYVLDMSGNVGSAAVKAPSIVTFEVRVIGKSAHAGFEPEKGIHAIAIMSEIIRRLELGHVDKNTTLNVGEICGGTAPNIVPETCISKGEIRSFDKESALELIENIKRIAKNMENETGAKIDVDAEIQMEAYQIEEWEPVVKRFTDACKKLNFSGELVETFGGSDNNNLVSHDIRGIVLSCGMCMVHSTGEYTFLSEIQKGIKLVAELITSKY